MIKNSIFIIIFFILPIQSMSQNGGRTPTFNFNLELTQPLGQFQDQNPDPFLGIDINGVIPTSSRSALGIGFNFGWGIINRTDGNLVINGFLQDVRFTDHIYTYSPFLRFNPLNSRFNPYIDGGIGVRRFLTRYSINNGGVNFKEIYGDQQFSLTWGWALGLEIFLNRSLFLEMRFEEFRGSEIEDLLGNKFQTNARGFGLGLGFKI